MSRIGKKIIQIPQGVKVSLAEGSIIVEGPKGKLQKELPRDLEVSLKEGGVSVFPRKKHKNIAASWGTTRALIANMVEGVARGFEKKLEIQGIGYKVQKEADSLNLEIGFTHAVKVFPPQGIEFSIEENRIIKVYGVDKELVGKVASKIYKIKKPDPYKGKGIRYLGEQIKLKPGKKAVGTGA